MKRTVIIVVSGVLALLLIYLLVVMGAFFLRNRDNPPPFRQSADAVIKIELYHNRDPMPILQLEGADAQEFMTQLGQLKCYKRFSPTDDIGVFEIRIYYAADNADVIGSSANGSILQGSLHIDGWYYYAEADLQVLFAKFVDASLIPQTP